MDELSKSILKAIFKVKNITCIGVHGNIGAKYCATSDSLEEWAKVGKDGKYLPPIYELKTNLERLTAKIQDSPFMRPANNI